ncbi:MAG: sulfurtransferase TusA family protein [Magnetococcales bacterium]|nr:sulfurtransferase TusA family protein [Magnetococcales bacterium]
MVQCAGVLSRRGKISRHACSKKSRLPCLLWPPQVTDAFIDITGEVCPLTFVRVKLKLETMAAGTTLGIRLNPGEPLDNIPRSLQEEGCRIVSLTPDGEAFLLVAAKPG